MERRYGLRKGSWTEEEDLLLKQCIQKYGEGRWRQVPPRAGLNRCSKSCRLRWLNYLRPNIKRGQFEADEIDLILKMHKLLGNRWALIAGRLPGRTANDVKNYWNTHLNKKVLVCHDQRPVVDHEEEEDQIKENKSINNIHPAEMAPETKLIKPQPLNFSKNSKWFRSSGNDTTTETETETETETTEIQQSDIEMFINTTTDHEKTTSEPADDNDERMVWLESILLEREVEEEEEEEETAEDQMMISSDHHEVITTSSVRVDDGESAVLVEAKNDWDLLNVDDENFHFWHMLLLPDEQ